MEAAVCLADVGGVELSGDRMRIAIIGGPRTGKTTLGKKLAEVTGLPYRSTDETLGMFDHLPEKERWSAASAEVSKWLNGSSWIIEGVALPRALRKWRDRNDGESAPVDKIIYLQKPFEELKPGQMSMTKGVATVMEGLADWLPKIEYR